MLKAIVFDFDGTILDTEGPDYQSWREVYAEFGCELPFDLWLKVVGTSHGHFDPHTHLETEAAAKGFPSLDWPSIRGRRRARMVELVAGQAIRPGVREWIDEAAARGLRLGVASSSSRDWVVGQLERLGLLACFGAVCVKEDVERVKPDPAVYRLALERLGVEPQHALAIEDSRNGMLAAKAAGMRCVVAPNPITETMAFDEADWCVRSLAEIRLDQLTLAFEKGCRGNA